MYVENNKNIYFNEVKPKKKIHNNILQKNSQLNNLKNDFIFCNRQIKKNSIYIYFKNIYFYHINSFILIFTLLLIQIYSTKTVKIKALSFSYEITIKIKGNGTQYILWEGQVPSRIFLNNNASALAGDKIIHNLKLDTNLIRMEWDSPFSDFHAMFYGLSNIIEIDFSNFNSSQVVNMAEMFHGCSSLQSINFNNFQTISVTNMSKIFFECNELKSLDLSHFDTSSVISMDQMFSNCKSLKILNLTNFNTKKVENMREMFSFCEELEILDLSSFDTSSVKYMTQMFFHCLELKSLNLSNFNISLITDTSQMFVECKKLENLDISNFHTSQITSMGSMFYGCNSLKSLNLSHFNTSKVKYFDNMFGWCKSLETLYIRTFDTSSAEKLDNMFMHCEKLISLDLTHFKTSNVKDINHMFDSCFSLTSLELGNFDTSSVTNMEYMFSGCNSLISLNLYSFTTSEILSSFKGMFNEINSNLKYCINDIISEGIKSNLSLYNKLNCSDLCSESEYIPDKNKCKINCSNDDIFKFEYENECFISCPSGTYPVAGNLCEKGFICDNYYNYERTGCLDEIPLGYYLNNTIDKTIDKCNIKCSNCTKESMENDLCISCNNVQGYYQKKNDELNENSFFDCYKGEPSGYNLDEEKKYYQIDLNSPKSEQNYQNITFIDFSDKEVEYLYDKYNLEKGIDKIYALISDYTNDDPNMATRDYNLKFFLENGTELNLSIIDDDIYFDFYVPIDDLKSIHFNDAKELKEQGYDIYDKNSDFYNEYCSPAYVGENDIALKDRRKYIYPNNVSLCKENCKYNGVEIEDERVICSCNLNSNKDYEDKEDNNFIEEDGNFLSYFLDNINYNVFKCYDLISSYENLKNNYAFWTILGVFIILIIINLIFFLYSLPLIKKSMLKETPTFEKKRNDIIQKLLKIRSIKENTLFNKTKKENNFCKITKSNSILNTYSFLLSSKKKKVKRTIKNTPIKLNNNIFTPYKENKINDIVKINKKYKPFKTVNQLIHNNREIPLDFEENFFNNYEVEIFNYEKNKSYSNEEINELPYSQAIIIDKRYILKIWGSLLITKLELINLCCSKSTIKIILIIEYILSLLINFFFNTLLYSDEIVSHKYHNNGQLDIIVTLVLSLLSNIITSIIFYYIKYSKGIEERADLIKELKIKDYYINNVNIFYKYLRIKFVFFFLGEIMVIACCYYYIVIFCIIYSKSRESLVVNYLSSLVEGLVTSVAISILVLITRKIGLSCFNKHFYNVSKYINNRF